MAVSDSNAFLKINDAAHSGAFGDNPIPLPTEKQLEAGNYKKGKFNLHGLRIAIEYPQYSYRKGVDSNGKRWACRLAANYGYILGTKANDEKPVDCFVGSYPQSDRVYVINQYVNGKFDEHKVMLCYLSESFARSDYQLSYSPGWNGLHSIVELSVKQFKQWLKHGNMKQPLTAENLPITEIEKMKSIYWTDDNQPAGITVAKLIYDLQALDKDDGLLLDSISADDIYHDYGDCMLPETAFLDSLNMPYSQLERRMGVVRGAFNRAGTDLKVTEPGEGETSPQIIGPYKKDGVTMITALFNLTDGQTVSIVFHNPDSTPAKITPSDTVIAWKWLLNKKDITIIVAPEKGEDLKPMDVAKRIMKLAEKNSAAFQRANGKVAEQNQAIADLNTEISELESKLALAKANYEVAKQAADDREVAQATNPVPEATAATPEADTTIPEAVGDFVATHTYHDSDLGMNVPVMQNEDGNWQSADGIEYIGIDDEVEAIGAGVVEPQPEPVVTTEPVAQKGAFAVIPASDLLRATSDNFGQIENYIVSKKQFDSGKQQLFLYNDKGERVDVRGVKVTGYEKNYSDMDVTVHRDNLIFGDTQQIQTIDPVAKSNIEAANISAAIKKKAIAYLNANPTSHTIEGISPKSLKAIMESIKAALFTEIKALSTLFEDYKPKYGEFFGDSVGIAIGDSALSIGIGDQKSANPYRMDFLVITDAGKNQIFDSTQTLEDLRAWGFALPFDLDVKAFVANVIKPVVDEFLAKQAAVPEPDKNDPEAELVSKILSDIEILKQDVVDGKFDSPEHYISNYNQIEDRVIAANLGSNEKLVDAFRQLSDAWDANKMKNSFSDTPAPEPQPPVVETPTNSFDADIEALRGLAGKPEFDSEIDALAEKIDSAGLMEQYDAILADLVKLDANAVAGGI